MRKIKRLLLPCCLILCLFGCKKEETADITIEEKSDMELDDEHTKESDSENNLNDDSEENIIAPQKGEELTLEEINQNTYPVGDSSILKMI